MKKDVKKILKVACRRSSKSTKDAPKKDGSHFSMEDVECVLKKKASEEKERKNLVPSKVPNSHPAASTSSKRVLHTASLADLLGTSHNLSTAAQTKVPEKWKEHYRKLQRLKILLTSSSVAQEKGDEELLEFVLDRQRTLMEVEVAIDRILKGTYGICEITHKSIEPNRLQAIPYTRYSLEGQRQMEKHSVYPQNSYDSDHFLEDDEDDRVYPSDDDASDFDE